MNTLRALVIAGLAATILALIRGITSMAHGGSSEQERRHFLLFQRLGGDRSRP